MESVAIPLIKPSKSNSVGVVDFYNEATRDYRFWSNDFNMHFGYYLPFKTNLLKRDSMLNEMNAQILKRLHLGDRQSRLVDLGCGMGATMRYALANHSNLRAYGITLADFQVSMGNKLLNGKKGIILKEDYNRTSFCDNSFDNAVAIESFCHSGHSKVSLQEAHRILKKEGKLVVADAFLKQDVWQLSASASRAYHQLCDHWALPSLATIAQMKANLEKVGFGKMLTEEISLRVAPSVLHVPFAILGFLVKKWWRGDRMKPASWHNLKGSFFALLSGLHFKSFGYYLITATK